jgi:Tol biopolymer transport system component
MTGRVIDAWNEREPDRRGRELRRKAGVFALVVVLMAAFVGAFARVGGSEGPAGTAASQTPAPPSTLLKHAFVDVRNGALTPLPEAIDGGYSYRVSPDGSMFAFEACCGKLALVNMAGTGGLQITPDRLNVQGAAWSPDGSKLVFQGRRDGREAGNLFVVRVATGAVKRITDLEPMVNGWWFLWPSFAPDGDTILFHRPRREVAASGQVWDLWSVPVSGGEPTLVRRDAALGQYSPDGRSIAYLPSPNPADAIGRSLWLMDATGGDPRELIEDRGIWWPRWSPDGTRIAYSTTDDEIHVVDVATGQIRKVADGGVAEWFDDHTLIVGPGGRR